MGGALAGPVTAYVYDWNMLPIGQALWLKELESYIDFPPMQDPASYNLEQVVAAGEEACVRPVALVNQALVAADHSSRRRLPPAISCYCNKE